MAMKAALRNSARTVATAPLVKVKRSIRMEGAPEADKRITIEVELHADNIAEGAKWADIRVWSAGVADSSSRGKTIPTKGNVEGIRQLQALAGKGCRLSYMGTLGRWCQSMAGAASGEQPKLTTIDDWPRKPSLAKSRRVTYPHQTIQISRHSPS